MSIESVMPSSYLILCCPLLLLPSIVLSLRVFSNESALHIRWPKYWNFSFNTSPTNEHLGLISFRMDWSDLLQSKGLSRVFSSTTVLKRQFFRAQPSSRLSTGKSAHRMAAHSHPDSMELNLLLESFTQAPQAADSGAE